MEMRAGWCTFPLSSTVTTASALMWVRLRHHHSNHRERLVLDTQTVSCWSQMADFRPSKPSLTSGDNADWCLVFSPVLSAWVVIRVHACVSSACWFMLNLRVLLIWRCACVSAHTLTDFSMAAIKTQSRFMAPWLCTGVCIYISLYSGSAKRDMSRDIHKIWRQVTVTE